MKKILIVEDELHLAEGLRLNLSLKGYEANIADNGNKALDMWKGVDLVILDIMLPGLDGLKVLERIRKENSRIPILILSAKGQTEDKVKAFKFGVDDYLAKPFELDELLVRVERLLEKSSWLDDSKESLDNFTFGQNEVDFSKAMAKTSKGPIELTDQEMKILRVFFENPDKSMSREEVLVEAWGYDEKTSTRTLDNFIVRFRKYFEDDPKSPKFFKSIRSIGYMFSP